MAAYFNKLDIMKMLIESGAHVNATNDFGEYVVPLGCSTPPY